MRPIWKGSINFGLVNIPVTLYTAVRKEELKFRMLRESDRSPIHFKRVAEADGKEVPFDQITKGFEYEKGKFVIMTEDDFDRVDIEATKSITIETFVDQSEVSPLQFYKPYFLEPQKGADHAYVLLRDALTATGKIGIARVVISTRQHLAALKPHEGALVLELMHFADELVSADEFRRPAEGGVGKKELEMAKHLIVSMSETWQPDAFKDDYTEAVRKIIADKIKAGGKALPPPKSAPRPSNVVDLMAALEQSLASTGIRKKKSAVPVAMKTKPRKKAG